MEEKSSGPEQKVELTLFGLPSLSVANAAVYYTHTIQRCTVCNLVVLMTSILPGDLLLLLSPSSSLDHHSCPEQTELFEFWVLRKLA